MEKESENSGDSLSLKQRAFVHIVASGCTNRTEACRLAGYADDSRKSLSVKAAQLWNDPRIQAYWQSLCPEPPSEASREYCLGKIHKEALTSTNPMTRLKAWELFGRWQGFDTQRIRVDVYDHHTVDDIVDALRELKEREYAEQGEAFVERELLLLLQVVGNRDRIEDVFQKLPRSDSSQVIEHAAA